MEKKHIVICGDRQVGKTTLVKRLLNGIDVPVHGFVTSCTEPDERNVRGIYMYSPLDTVREKGDFNRIGSTDGTSRKVNLEVFDTLGVRLLTEPDDGIIVMDELGFMETRSERFCGRVLECFDGDIPVLATVKSIYTLDFLNAVRNHPKAEVYNINPENRDELFEILSVIIREIFRTGN